MVIKGKYGRENSLAHVKFEGVRIRLPSPFAERAGLAGSEKISCWLLVVTPGRYRLITKAFAETSRDFSRIVDQIDEIMAPGDVLDRTDNNEQDALPARLIPCAVSPRGPGWRINFPKEARELATGDRSFVFLQIVAGFVEVWFPDMLRQAVSVPISEVLP